MSNPFTTKDQLVDIINQVVLGEKKLTDDELKKREEIAQAMERENPGMDMSKKMAIATAQAKKVAEEVEQIDEASYNKDSEHHRNARKAAKSMGGKATYHPNGHASVSFQDVVHGRSTVNPKGTVLSTGEEDAKRAAKSHGGKAVGNVVHFKEEVEQIDEVGNTEKGQIDLRKYKEKAKKDMGDAGEKLWYKSVTDKDIKGKWALAVQRDKRRKGIQRADARIEKAGGNLDEQLENFWEAYTTMFNEAEDQQQNMLLRAMAKDPSDLMKMKRAIKMGDKALTNPALRQEILKMLDQMMTLTTGDKSLLQRTRMGFQKAKTMEMPEESNVAANAQRDSNPDSAGYHRRKEMKLLRGISKATDKLTKEEVESLDELSKKTLGSYIEKAANSGAIHHADVVKKKETADEVDRFTNRNDMNDKYAERERIKKSLGASNADINNSYRKVSNRFTGLGRAVKRLTKEEVEELDEAIGAKDKQDEGEYGYEGDMAMSQLRTIIRNCQEMMKVLDKETDMPEWVQSKITLATDYLQTANDYLMSELEEETEINELSKGLMYRYFSKADKSGSEKRYAGMTLRMLHSKVVVKSNLKSLLLYESRRLLRAWKN